MSTTTAPTTTRAGGSGPTARFAALPTPVRWMVVALGAVALISLVRIVSGSDDIDSSGAIRAALISSVPIALAGLGGLWSERAGVVNIGLEGMMIAGALGAGYFTYHQGVLAGVLGGIVFGMVGGLLHAVATVLVGVDHIVSGVAINIIAAGVTGFLAESFFSGLPGGGPTQSPSLDRPPSITIGPLVDLSGRIEDKGWFVVSDVFSLIGGLSRGMSSLTLLAIALLVFTSWVLWRTAFGLRLRSCGESPSAAESLGVNVYLYKMLAVTVSGGFAGLAGAYLALVASSGYQNGMSNGLGYIGLAAMIFGNWRPAGLLLGALIFGYTTAVELRGGTDSLHALLLLAGVALLLIGISQLRRGGSRTRTVVSLVLGVGFIAWFALTDEIAPDFASMAPYVATLFVLAYASQSLRMPAADGLIYRKGSAG